LVVSHEHGLMLGARTFSGNPYDGHILSASLEQATNLTQDLQVQIKESALQNPTTPHECWHCSTTPSRNFPQIHFQLRLISEGF